VLVMSIAFCSTSASSSSKMQRLLVIQVPQDHNALCSIPGGIGGLIAASR
jgi:hypothetical protein